MNSVDENRDENELSPSIGVKTVQRFMTGLKMHSPKEQLERVEAYYTKNQGLLDPQARFYLNRAIEGLTAMAYPN